MRELLLVDQKWNCCLKFNEADPSSKRPYVVDLMEKMRNGETYIFPRRLKGIEARKQLVVELKIAAIQAGFNLTGRSCKSKKQLELENSSYSCYIQLNCTNGCLYDCGRRQQRTIKGIYKTRTHYQTSKDKLCDFKLIIGCRLFDQKWELRPPMTCKRL